jgi:8-oxo-dGTP pyrophosphatase MutT (NUDIX family)
MKNNIFNSIILSDKPFKEDTYTIVHTKSSLDLKASEKKLVDTNWHKFLTEAQSKGFQPWDGTYYRMENIQDIASGSKEIYLSTIKYSQVRGLKHNVNKSLKSTKFQANNVDTASLILTNDDFFVFGVRNCNSPSISKMDLIGGGLQENEFVVKDFSDIFKNVLKEIEEETGLTVNDIKIIQGIGIVHSCYSNVLFVFFTKLNKCRTQVQKIFSNNDDDEMVELEFVEKNFLRDYLKDKGSYRPLTVELYFKNIK